MIYLRVKAQLGKALYPENIEWLSQDTQGRYTEQEATGPCLGTCSVKNLSMIWKTWQYINVAEHKVKKYE